MRDASMTVKHVEGAPRLDFKSNKDGSVSIFVHDTADKWRFNDVHFYCAAEHAERLERAVQKFNEEMAR